MLRIQSRVALTPFTTADGSQIRELAHPRASDAQRQSLAEATLEPGGETREHLHPACEEDLQFLSGAGLMRVGDAEGRIGAGDTVVIPPGTRHKLWNDGAEPLVLLCCCSPAYSDAGTVITDRAE
jgi:mannose-6-phosphate isomerase-like protein (cupin superfamily)